MQQMILFKSGNFNQRSVEKSIMSENNEIVCVFEKPYPKVESFQERHTKLWNDKANELTKLYVPRVSLYNELKLDEYGMAVVDLLVMVGILDKNDSDDNHKHRWVLNKDWLSKKCTYVWMVSHLIGIVH